MRDRMMRVLLLISTTISTLGCGVPVPPDPPLSIHDRLSASPLRFAITGTGSIDAEHRAIGDSWVGGGASITISTGALVASLVGDTLVIDAFDVSLDPVELPAAVFHQPASLTGVRIMLTRASSAAPTWTTADEATATLALDLDLAWSITISGGSTSLGVQHLPTISMDVELTRSDSTVDAALELQESGELWSWASLVRLSDLALDLAATGSFE